METTRHVAEAACAGASLPDASTTIVANPIGDPPAWITLGRNDLLALFHGLSLPQAGAWAMILAEAMSSGNPRMAVTRCREIADRHWDALSRILVRTRRVFMENDEILIDFLKVSFAKSSTRIAKAKHMRAGHGK